jgi:hypothetical protein
MSQRGSSIDWTMPHETEVISSNPHLLCGHVTHTQKEREREREREKKRCSINFESNLTPIHST